MSSWNVNLWKHLWKTVLSTTFLSISWRGFLTLDIAIWLGERYNEERTAKDMPICWTKSTGFVEASASILLMESTLLEMKNIHKKVQAFYFEKSLGTVDPPMQSCACCAWTAIPDVDTGKSRLQNIICRKMSFLSYSVANLWPSLRLGSSGYISIVRHDFLFLPLYLSPLQRNTSGWWY